MLRVRGPEGALCLEPHGGRAGERRGGPGKGLGAAEAWCSGRGPGCLQDFHVLVSNSGQVTLPPDSCFFIRELKLEQFYLLGLQ